MTDNSNRPAKEFLTTSIQRLGSSSHGYEPSISPAYSERSTSLTPAVSVESPQISRQFSLPRGDREGAIHSLRRSIPIKPNVCLSVQFRSMDAKSWVPFTLKLSEPESTVLRIFR